MLYTVDKKKIEYIPHRRHYDYWRRNLDEDKYVKIMSELEKYWIMIMC